MAFLQGIFGSPSGGGGGVTDHGALTGLTDDDHSQYPLSAGRAGGQSLVGGTAASEKLQLQSTANATRGLVESLDDFHVTRSESGGLVEGRVVNGSNTASSDARLRLDVGGSAGGVPYLYLRAVNGTRDASIGIDNDANAAVKFSHQEGIGANVALQYDANLDVEIPGGNLLVSNGQAGAAQEDLSGTGASNVDTIDWNLGNAQIIDLEDYTSGPVTLTLLNPVAGSSYIVKVIQGSTAYDITWPASVKWPAGVAPVISTTNNDEDLISLYYDGTNYYASFGQAFS